MRICYLCNLKFNAVRLEVEYFCNHGYDIHIITTHNYAGEFNCNNIYPLNIEYPTSVKNIFDFAMIPIKVRRLIQKIKPDILHVYDVGGKGALAMLSGFNGIIIGSTSGSDILHRNQKSFYMKYLQKQFLRRANLLTINELDLKEEVIKLGVDSKKIILLYFGINISEFNPDLNDSLFKKSLAPEGLIVTIVSQFKYPYAVDIFIKAASLILQKFPETTFLVIGSGELEQKLKDLAINTGVDKNIIFIGQIDYKMMKNYYSITDVFTLTCSGCGGVSTALLEAMACALPVVVTDTGAYREFVKNEINGYVVPIGDLNAFAKSVCTLLNDAKLRKKFGKQGRSIVEKNGDLEKNMRKMEYLYKHCLEGV